MAKIANHRIHVLESLLEVEQGKHAEDCIEGSQPEERALNQHVLFGVLRFKGSLDRHIRQFVRKNPKRIIRNILRIALFEHFFSRTPTHALIHQAVELCRHVGRKNDVKFVNAVLRKAIAADLNTDPYNDLPEWLGNRWKKDTVWVQSLRKHPRLAFYYQTPAHKEKSSRKEESVQISDTYLENMSYPVIEGSIVSQQGYEDGDWWIMNPAAAYPIELLSKTIDLKDKKVLDMCAAPGGKSFCLLAKGAEVIATDSSSRRLSVMKENLIRLNFQDKITLLEHDWQQENSELDLFDVVVLDAPCSGTGVIRKHPEIKWKRTEQDVLAATILQKRLLKRAESHVREGGILLYCVCSVLWEEGTSVIRNLNEKKWVLRASWNSLQEQDEKLDGFQVFMMENRGGNDNK